MSRPASKPSAPATPRRDAITLRFAGDAGDSMTLAGVRFAAAAAQAGNDVHTLILPPIEIRAPAGATTAVSAYQVHFGSKRLFTPGDKVDALVAMNPASLKLHLPDVAPGGMLIINTDTFDAGELERARYASNPLEDGSLASYRVTLVPIHRFNRDAVAPVKLLSPREADRSRNIFALGLACWLFDRPLDSILRWMRTKFARNPAIVDANTRALHAGFSYGEGLAVRQEQTRIAAMPRTPGIYRRISGHEALSLGLATAAYQAKKRLIYAGFPMTPACELQQHLRDLRECGVQSVDTEDEMAAAGMALGAAFAGSIGVSVTTGPGLCLMGEILGLAVVSELPLVIIDVMRAGPGNGIPNASDQADLFQAIFGRNGDSPVVVLAPTSPADGFATACLAVRLAVQAMTPVIVLTDTHLGLASETWQAPALGDLSSCRPEIGKTPFQRNASGAPQWVTPGTVGGEHRQTGLEKDEASGRASSDANNHERMVARRIAKIDRLADDVPPAEILGPERGEVLVVGWGSVCGTIRAAVEECQTRGWPVAGAALTSLHPLPRNLGEVLGRYRHVIVAELNAGQLAMVLCARYGVPVIRCNKIQARPFTVSEILEAVRPYVK